MDRPGFQHIGYNKSLVCISLTGTLTKCGHPFCGNAIYTVSPGWKLATFAFLKSFVCNLCACMHAYFSRKCMVFEIWRPKHWKIFHQFWNFWVPSENPELLEAYWSVISAKVISQALFNQLTSNLVGAMYLLSSIDLNKNEFQNELYASSFQ